MNPSKIIAINLKRLRTERNLSLGQLSQLSDVSKVMLAQLEKGETNPTINTLWKIANGLKVPYTLLLEQIEPTAAIVRSKDTLKQLDEDGHYRLFCYYSNTPSRNFEQFLVELDADHSHYSVGHSERVQEYILVLEGKMKVVVDEDSYILSPKDAIQFDASLPHAYFSIGDTTLKVVLTIYYAL